MPVESWGRDSYESGLDGLVSFCWLLYCQCRQHGFETSSNPLLSAHTKAQNDQYFARPKPVLCSQHLTSGSKNKKLVQCGIHPRTCLTNVCTLCSDFQPLTAVSKRLGKQVHHVLGLYRPLSFRGTSHDKSASATSAAVDQYQVEHTTMFMKRLGLRTLSYSLATLTPDLLQLGEDGLRCSALSLNFSIWRSRGTTTCMQLPACDDGHCMQQRCTE